MVAASPPIGADRAWFPRFCAGLRRLQQGQRDRHVRLLWFGDSHTYADFLTHAVRRPLQERYGNGGPGFLHLGIERYRHGGVRMVLDGKWRFDPPQPSRSSRWADGVFGLGGIRAVPDAAGARTGAELLRGAVAGRARWELYYRLLDARASLQVQVDEQEARRLSGRTQAGSRVQHASFEGSADGRLVVRDMTGEPQLLGVAVESSEPGFVLDTLGINGARAATPLAWDEAAWVALVRERRPDLVVLAYGTNEVFANQDPRRYHAHFDDLMRRLRSARAGVECLMIGPTDVARAGGSSHPRVAVIDAVQRAAAARLGCGFFSLQTAMGGEGGFAAWAAQEPPLAGEDRVHLTRQGYERLGARVVDALLAACE